MLHRSCFPYPAAILKPTSNRFAAGTAPYSPWRHSRQTHLVSRYLFVSPLSTPANPTCRPQSVRPDKTVDQDDRWRAAYLESLMKNAGELSVRVTTIDANGELKVESGTYRKMDLCKRHDVDPRDLRKLDSLQPNLVPTILSRRTTIIVNMLHIRALIKADTVILFDAAPSLARMPSERADLIDRGGRLKERFRWHIQGNLKALRREERRSPTSAPSAGNLYEEEEMKAKKLSYEHRALESILISVANALEEELIYTRHIMSELLNDLEDHIDRENLKRLLYYARRLAGFQSRVKYVFGSIAEVLESDEDLSAMYLSAKKLNEPRDTHDHEELELLLESFSKQVEEIMSEVDTIVSNTQSTQEIAELMLDYNRNTLIAMELKVSIATLGIGVAALTTGIFGMNLVSHLEDGPYTFYLVASMAIVSALTVTVVGLRRLARMRKMGINALHGRASRSGLKRIGV
ncbi:magnesium ion transporter [Naganishia albida]|nr:magnesium ion transporter [Naganishia albida]